MEIGRCWLQYPWFTPLCAQWDEGVHNSINAVITVAIQATKLHKTFTVATDMLVISPQRCIVKGTLLGLMKSCGS